MSESLAMAVAAEDSADAPRCMLGVENSVLGRRWVSRDPAADRLGLAIAQAHGLPEVVGRVLAARGVPLEEAEAYLAPTLRELMPNPASLKDMDAAADDDGESGGKCSEAGSGTRHGAPPIGNSE